jgi:hypothetical protein
MENRMNAFVAPAIVVGAGGLTAAAWAGLRRRRRASCGESPFEGVLRRMERPDAGSGHDRGSGPIPPGAADRNGDDAA